MLQRNVAFLSVHTVVGASAKRADKFQVQLDEMKAAEFQLVIKGSGLPVAGGA